MFTHISQVSARLALSGTLLMVPTACAPLAGPSVASSEVAQAYETSGLIILKPYTRSIINTNDF